ncbi:MAG: hypothetical protein MK074_06015 [Phycisphaerales bacterium]|nr:hypothetical protein [Phycisphaerales bacterium]
MLGTLLIATLLSAPAGPSDADALPGEYAWTVNDLHAGCVAPSTERGAIALHGDTLAAVHANSMEPFHWGHPLEHPPSGMDTWTTNRGGIVLARPDTGEVIALLEGELKVLTTRGNRMTQCNGPADVACNGTRIAVADRGNRRILLLDMTGANMGMYSSAGEHAFALPSGVALDEDSTLYITDEATHHVHCIEADGRHRWSVGGWGKAPGRFAEPAGIDVRDGVILVADRLNHRIQALHADTGRVIDWWGMHAIKPREGDGKIHYPEDVAFTEDGCVVAEPFERRVQGFTLGRPDKAKAPTGPVDSQSHFGPRMAVHGRALVVFEPELRAFHLLDLDREIPVHTTTFGEHGTGAGCVQLPVEMTLHGDGDDYTFTARDATDGRTHTWTLPMSTLERPGFHPDLAVLLQATAPDSTAPVWSPAHSSDTTDDGITATLQGDSTIAITRDGATTKPIGGHGIDHGTFWNPSELHIDSQRRILVLDHGNHRLQAFDLDGNWLMTFGTGRAYTPKNTPSMRRPTP